MKLSALQFARPADLVATSPPEARGMARDEVRLLVSTESGHRHAAFADLPGILEPGDLLVVNRSATLPASLPARGRFGSFILNVSTRYSADLVIAEPRFAPGRPGPVPLDPDETFAVAGTTAHLVAPYPGLPRLWFVAIDGDVGRAMDRYGSPIRYDYVDREWPLEAYQTLFATVPGSAEMPSAARPFTPRVMHALKSRGVGVAAVTLHCGVSSLEVETDDVASHPMYPESYEVPAATAVMVNRARAAGRRVIAVGTTVVKALESAWAGGVVAATRGFTRHMVHPGTGIRAVDGLLTGLHDPLTSHLALLQALAGPELIEGAYLELVSAGYLWHEFGDSHLILPA